jgi:putative DNA methylase
VRGDELPVAPLERRGFPASVSRIAEYESWRKELHRPATYVHKWWARRLGAVFRQVLLNAAPWRPSTRSAAPLDGLIVFDPFAGSGTTLVEACKLGARVVGRDINPIATLTQRQALQRWDPAKMERLYKSVEAASRAEIDALFAAADGSPVLHFFWVAVTACPECGDDVELYSSYVFARHAYPRKFPRAHATCPHCHDVVPVELGRDTAAECAGCNRRFAFTGPVKGRTMTCPRGHRSPVLAALAGQMPRRRMYAKMIKLADERRAYRPIDKFDLDLYDHSAKLLANAPEGHLVLPEGGLEFGTNTVQALNWGYRTWASFFNDRQLYALGRIGAALRDLPGRSPEREALIAAFGKTLEYHNVFCSYKGEGTGPVRSIFHNHVLRPERCSVEGNPWGAEGGSGGYADALDRLTRAHAYKESPTDLEERGGEVVKVTGVSEPVSRRVATTWEAFAKDEGAAYVKTGDAATTDLPDGSIALVVTDPPYVDNVHYSELADFFHAWMRLLRPYTGYPRRLSTRDRREVQSRSPNAFHDMITDVWSECRRVLRPDGVLVFSFHQSQTTGWAAIMSSLASTGFVVTATRPVVAEVTTSLTKAAANEPNRVDVIVVCRSGSKAAPVKSPKRVCAETVRALNTLKAQGIDLGAGDVRSAVRAAVLAQGTRSPNPDWERLRAEADVQANLAVRSFGAS